MRVWKAFNNKFWPAHYFVDAKGQIREHHFGEGIVRTPNNYGKL